MEVIVYLYIVSILSSLPNITSSEKITKHKTYATRIKEYTGNPDIELVHFLIPRDTTIATWNFTAIETDNKCSQRNVSIFLRHGSFPVVNPYNALLPNYTRLEIIPVELIHLFSNVVPVYYSILVPLPGDWFASAFVHAEDDRITQKGLSVSCQTLLQARLQTNQTENIQLIAPQINDFQEIILYQEIKENEEVSYKYYVSKDIREVLVNILACQSNNTNVCQLTIYSRPSGLPHKNNSNTEINTCSESSLCSFKILPWEEEWHYLLIESTLPNTTFKIQVQLLSCDTSPKNIQSFLIPSKCSNKKKTSKELKYSKTTANISASDNVCWNQIPLMRFDNPDRLSFTYRLDPDETNFVNISNSKTSNMDFYVNPLSDIGRTLSIIYFFDPVFLEAFSNNSDTTHYISIVACVSYQKRIEPEWFANMTSPQCEYSTEFSMLHINSTDGPNNNSFIADTMYIPYPSPGLWHITYKVFCYEYHNLTDEHIFIDCLHNESPIYFSVTSFVCMPNGCGNFGECHVAPTNGFIYSSCDCNSGYRGYACNDHTYASTGEELTNAILFLTISNIAFVPAICIAVYRRFFTETLVYCCTMLFSTLYHACDERSLGFCLLPFSVLQFCDFYSAVLAFWVTLLAMAYLPIKLESILHMAGAIGIALGITYDRTGLAVFMIPTVSGIIIMIIAWIIHGVKLRSCFPSKKYWLMCFPIGLLLAIGGLVLYAFYETESNYRFVHSIWHATIGLSIAFFLPLRNMQKSYLIGFLRADMNDLSIFT